MATISKVTLDDIQLQTNSCYLSKTSEPQMYANPCYQYYNHRNIHYNKENKCRSDMNLKARENINNPSQQLTEVVNESAHDDIVKQSIDKDNIRGRLYIMATLTMVLLIFTVAVIVLSAVTYTQLQKRMYEQTQFSRPLTRIKNDTNLQATELKEGVSQALIQFNSTKSAIMALQSKLKETKLRASQILLQIEERQIVNTSKIQFEENPTIQTQETQAEILQVQLYCGAGEWHRVAQLNMSDPEENCPSAWVEYTSDGIRACRRPYSDEDSCPDTVYPINDHPYSKVCGRVIGYQFGSPDAFGRGGGITRQFSIKEPYVDGVSITHGSPRNHIWTYVAGAAEQRAPDCSGGMNTCPCSGGPDSPSYVGNNYYCESAFQGNCFVVDTFFPNDPLWDGQQCDNEGTCCTGANTPPWFSVDLTDTTSDDIEVRICHNQSSSDEDTLIELIEIYVQ